MDTAGNAAAAATTASEAGYDEIYVNPVCHVQTGRERFGPAIAEEIHNYVAEPAHQAIDGGWDLGWDDMDEDESDDDSDDDDEITDALDNTEWDGTEFGAIDHGNNLSGSSFHDPNNHQTGGVTAATGGGGVGPITFPKVARHRCNLTALSQRFNLYFAAYQDKIHVFVPGKAPRFLPPPSLILTPVRTKLAKLYPGEIDRKFSHQVNNLIVGNLGNLEIVLFAFDDGDVGAYHTNVLAEYITTVAEAIEAGRHRHPYSHFPKQFFAENVGLSAWGLAVHQQSRLIAVGSNRQEITVFAFALKNHDRRRQHPTQTEDPAPEIDDSPMTWSGQTALELQKHYQSRTRTWKMTFPLGMVAHNIPSVSFMDDPRGNAEKVVAMDITAHTWIVDLWSIGTSPVLYTSSVDRHSRYKGWMVLALPDSAFKRTKSMMETIGLPEKEVIRPSGSQIKLDTTCGLYYIKDLASDPDHLLTARAAINYKKVHEDGFVGSKHWQEDAGEASESPPSSDWESVSDIETDLVAGGVLNILAAADTITPAGTWVSNSDGPPTFVPGGTTPATGWGHATGNGLPGTGSTSTSTQPPPADERWSTINTLPPPPGSELSDISDEIQLRREILPCFGEVVSRKQPPLNSYEYTRACKERQKRTKPIAFEKANLPLHLTKDYSLLRTTLTDVELLSLDPSLATVGQRWVLTYHNHHGITLAPHQFSQAYTERINMILHVPELYLIVAGSPAGRVALITLTKTAKQRVHGVPMKRGFRVDRVLPRREDEEKRLRPWCALAGIAISPVPDAGAKGSSLRLRAPPKASSKARHPMPTMWRLMLHYLDHSILMYHIERMEDDELLIF
ncbi:hypothetical protein QBC35DRAFT_485858 [Podospora australis]|uniref:Uncharacterized protein n=1 Tax=Podospora australis TaxID=1536484 RepID=A0AAN7AMQ0_9PEZI|nr:hypothetical protein QBC35DRAFT_485858 [Podospora australis]